MRAARSLIASALRVVADRFAPESNAYMTEREEDLRLALWASEQDRHRLNDALEAARKKPIASVIMWELHGHGERCRWVSFACVACGTQSAPHHSCSCGANASPELPRGAADETAWLIEFPGRLAPEWWRGRAPGRSYPWTTDANGAIRFARREDADLAIKAFGCPDGSFASEHMWCP